MTPGEFFDEFGDSEDSFEEDVDDDEWVYTPLLKATQVNI